jgi:RNA-binding protein
MKSSLKQTLKSRAHHLKPVILLGAKGLTSAVLEEAELALGHHELIKIKIASVEKEDRLAIIEEICQKLKAELVQNIGNILVIFRKKPDA